MPKHSGRKEKVTVTTDNETLETLIDIYIKDLLETFPIVGTACGLHEYDGRLPDTSATTFRNRMLQLKEFRERVRIIGISLDDKESKFDYELLLHCIDKELFSLEEMREHEISPLYYGGLTDVSVYIKRDYAPLEHRLEMVIRHLEKLPKALGQGLENLEMSLSRPALETALEMFKGIITYLEGDVTTQFVELNNATLTAQYTATCQKAIEAINNYIDGLEKRLPLSHNNFAIGAERYRRMLFFGEMVGLPLDELLEVGQRNLRVNQELLRSACQKFAPDLTVQEAMAKMASHHPTPESLIADTTAKLEEVRQFLIEHNIISVPSEVRCIVAETPPFMRWAFAFMDTPGAFEEIATQSYYYITPVESHWTEQQKEEWLTKFDYFTLQDVSIHEAYPGHYLHYMHFKLLNNRLRRLLWSASYSYSFVEGWAHYTEQMMIEEGYGTNDPRYHMAQLSEALLRNCRYIVSIMMHTQGMGVEEATRFFMENAYMEETPAASEARRGTFDPGYLNYTLGKLLILKLREDYKKEKGEAFSLREFHDQLLAYGAPPVPLVKTMLLNNNNSEVL